MQFNVTIIFKDCGSWWAIGPDGILEESADKARRPHVRICRPHFSFNQRFSDYSVLVLNMVITIV